MSVILYDESGEEVNFPHAIDAREAVKSGLFSESMPKKENKLSKEELKAQEKAAETKAKEEAKLKAVEVELKILAEKEEAELKALEKEEMKEDAILYKD